MTPIRPNQQGVFPRVTNGVHEIALGNGTQHRILVHAAHGILAIGIMGKGCYEFGHTAHPAYVMEKLGLHPYEGDANHVADFINDQIYQPGFIGRHGAYAESLCQASN